MSTVAVEERALEEQPPAPPPGDLSHLGDERKLNRLVLMLAWPAILENALQTLLGIVDTVLVARLGTDAIAGVGAGAQYMFLAFSIVFGFATGAVVLVARAIGGGDPVSANRAMRQAFLFAIGLGLLFTVLSVAFADQAMALLGATGDVAAIGASYMRIVSYAYVPMALTFMGSFLLRAAGDTRTPMWITAITNVLNAGAAYLLIFGGFGIPAMGTDGSAWGLNVARVASLAIMWWLLARGLKGLKLGRSGWAPRMETIKQIVRFGAPTAIEQILLMTSFMAFSMISLQLGTVAFATQRITFNAIMISFMPAFGFAMAATALTGQSLGARRPDLAEKTAWVAVRLAFIWMGLMGVVYFIAGEPLLRVFTDDPQVLSEGVPALRVIAAASPIWAIPMVLSGALRGAGDTRFPMYVTIVTGWLMRVPIGYAAGLLLGLGLAGVYLGAFADAVVGAAMVIWRYRRGAWRHIKVEQ